MMNLITTAQVTIEVRAVSCIRSGLAASEEQTISASVACVVFFTDGRDLKVWLIA